MWILSFKNWKVNTLPSKNIQTEQNYVIYFSLVLREFGERNQIFCTLVNYVQDLEALFAAVTGSTETVEENKKQNVSVQSKVHYEKRLTK